ncbi:hypothetical protein G6F57_004787 [Rhizopus arrhizus]|uniref:BHLH domain-containing protein n=1 Tax=Rhizopus oryzae TaxID=64495 RepID=A0A9P6X2A7_RHIOR|nr:hypothetical protein G6F23_010298 [Rhizopus arrhizus]KAG1400516.1 hypothetical protein G6F58_010930 [Rhizopus delemar]KAG0761921.1 hypothetical protein G6F24_007197 [Rhizopus arrhizus]KAG0778833.1 hypothetical protein G6F22_010999 [Rhizopus arrhizus]KAG0780996.1 hypothetical protein G6F21_011876 [Rhizopus arrhizus]
MNSSQSFCQYDYDNNQSISQLQQMELDRIHQVQQQAVLQRHMALLRQQMLYCQQSCLPSQESLYNNDFMSVSDNDSYQNVNMTDNNHIPTKIEKALKRAEHNAIERERREKLNNKYQQLALSLPNLQNDRRPSKGTILERTLEYVKMTVQKENLLKHEIDQLRKANHTLYSQMAAFVSDDDTDDDDIVETPEDAFSCKSLPSFYDAPLLSSFEKQDKKKMICSQVCIA